MKPPQPGRTHRDKGRFEMTFQKFGMLSRVR